MLNPSQSCRGLFRALSAGCRRSWRRGATGEAEELAARSAAEAEERRREAEELEEEREARARSKRAMRRIVRRLRCMHRLAAHAAAIGPSAVEDLTLDQLSAIWRR